MKVRYSHTSHVGREKHHVAGEGEGGGELRGPLSVGGCPGPVTFPTGEQRATGAGLSSEQRPGQGQMAPGAQGEEHVV